ncbi:MAG: hypothetical protein K9L78_02320 [Victivallales bacterium]|nr:hypothetical protein [Victivallales bacterium]MCF7888930.1 hypothetical protein [Victivallales bacterium]
MDSKIKRFVSKLLNEGVSLSDIQKRLQTEKDYKITFFDLRLLASELENIDWSKQKADVEAAEAKKKAKEEEEKAVKTDLENEAADDTGKTVVELSKLKRPGAVASGSVKFASGVRADWVIDQYGRLGLENNSGEPNEKDIQEFQEELQKKMAGGGI